jgi:hypothetical protein
MRNMQPRVAVAGVIVAVLLVTASDAAGRTKTAQQNTWSRTATSVCRSMWERMKSHRAGYWRPLIENRPLSRIAVLRDEWLVNHQDGLRAIRARAPAKTRLQLSAVGDYVHMLDTIRRVARAARTGDRRAYDVANIHMVLAIEETRRAFAHAGAGRICNFGI